MAWTIGELAEHAARLLGPDGQVSGRVRPVPNERLIRWYTTIGLLDPPIARRGRVALYGRRHLLQLVAIKRRQAARSEEHTSELQSRENLVCRLLLEKKKGGEAQA